MHTKLPSALLPFAFREVADGVVVGVAQPRLRPDGNVVLVDLGGEVLLVDATARRSSAQAVADFARRRFDGPIRTVVVTHHHWDHWQGNRVHVRDGVRLVAHPAAIEALRVDASASIAEQRRLLGELRSGAGPDVVGEVHADLADLDELAGALERGVPSATPGRAAGIPDEATTGPLTVAGSRREVRIVHLGHAHSPGDLFVEIPDAAAIATGDVVVGWTPFLRDADPTGWLRVLDRLIGMPGRHLLMGHGEPAAWSWLEAIRAYLADLLATTGQAFADGARGDQLVEAVRGALRPDHEAVLDAAAVPTRRWWQRMPANVARIEALLLEGGSVE